MKTLILTISRGSIAYNLLHNDFYRILREKYRIVILTSAHSDERFINEFAHPNVTFLPFDEIPHTLADRVVFFFHKYLIYNSTINKKARWGIIGDPKSKKPSYISYLIRKGIFVPLSKVRVLRDLFRAIDAQFLQKDAVRAYKELLKKEDAACVISTFISGNSEAALIKAARELDIPSIGFPKSWDNLSKHGFRAKADTLVVWNEFMKEQAVDFHNYKKEDVHVVGVPQFDRFVDESVFMSREAFCALYGLDPKRKIILFGSEGKLFPSDAEVAKVITACIAGEESQLLIRPHYGYKNDEEKFRESLNKEHVVVDLFNNPSEHLRDGWDYSVEFADRFINSLYHTDILINTASTLTLDAVSFDTPVISTALDGEEVIPYNRSVARWYETYYYKRILSYNATSFVRSKEELISALKRYLKNTEHKKEERRVLREDFCYKLDGKTGKRFAAVVENVVSKE